MPLVIVRMNMSVTDSEQKNQFFVKKTLTQCIRAVFDVGLG